MSDFEISVKEVNETIIITTNGYLNNVGGEKISEVCDAHMAANKINFLLNLENTKVVNSIGVSILIEIIEKLQAVDGSLGYFNLAPIVEKTFNIMGLTKYSNIYENEDAGLAGVSS
jgi:anti-anti-sigma factor